MLPRDETIFTNKTYSNYKVNGLKSHFSKQTQITHTNQ